MTSGLIEFFFALWSSIVSRVIPRVVSEFVFNALYVRGGV